MEERKIPSAAEIEKELGTRVAQLRRLLSDHIHDLEKIKHHYEGDLLRIDREYRQAKNAANNENDTAKNTAQGRYEEGARSANDRYQSRVNEEEKAYNSKKNQQERDRRSLSERNSARLTELQTAENAWEYYINTVHTAFNQAVVTYKQRHTNSIRTEYELLTRRQNQRALGEKGKVSYERQNPFLYALHHPFQEVPDAMNTIRVTVLILAILWLLIMVVICMLHADMYYDVREFMASAIVRYGLYALLLYLVAEFVCGFCATYAWVEDKNGFRQFQRENENNFILKDKAQASAELLKFSQKYKPIFFVNGKWDFDWKRYRITRDEANVLLNDVRKEKRTLEPKPCSGILPYVFEIDYNALNTIPY